MMLRIIAKKHYQFMYNVDPDNLGLQFLPTTINYIFISSQIGRLAQFAKKIMLQYDIVKARIGLKPVEIAGVFYYKLELFDNTDRFLYALTLEHTETVMCYEYIKRGDKFGRKKRAVADI